MYLSTELLPSQAPSQWVHLLEILLKPCNEPLRRFSIDGMEGIPSLGLSQLPALFYYFGCWKNVGKEDQSKGKKKGG